MKDTKSGVSAKEAERELYNGMVQGKKLYFKVSVDVAYCLSFLPWCDLVLVEAGVTKSAAAISTRPLMILNIIVTWLFLFQVYPSMSVTLLVFRYLFVAYLAARLCTYIFTFVFLFFFCVDASRPSQQLFSHVGTTSCIESDKDFLKDTTQRLALWWPCFLTDRISLNYFCVGSIKEHFCEVCLKLA